LVITQTLKVSYPIARVRKLQKIKVISASLELILATLAVCCLIRLVVVEC